MIWARVKEFITGQKRKNRWKKELLRGLSFVNRKKGPEVLFRLNGGKLDLVYVYRERRRSSEESKPLPQPLTEKIMVHQSVQTLDQGQSAQVIYKEEGIQASDENQVKEENHIQDIKKGEGDVKHEVPVNNPTDANWARIAFNDWTGFPTGRFQINLTREEAEELGGPMVHWATKGGGGYRNNPPTVRLTAKHPYEGYKTVRRCLGVIACRKCNRIRRPATMSKIQEGRLNERCSLSCAGRRYPLHCSFKITTWEWAGGFRLEGSGDHTHGEIPHLLHPTPREKAELEDLANVNPSAGPYALSVGIPQPGKPLKSAKDISPVYLNPDRLAKDLKGIRSKHTIGDELTFVRALTELNKKRPGFVKDFVVDGEVVVISVQTDFMLDQLLKDEVIGEPINGTVNDAAMGICKGSNEILMSTSTFSLALSSWSPSLFSWMNGSTAKHFQHHFRVLFATLAQALEERGETLQDEHFLGVMDFSEAERLGYIDAFKDFFKARKENARTDEELENAAQSMLRGCQEHYRASVTRIHRLGIMKLTGRADEFRDRSIALLAAKNSQDFHEQAMKIASDFPNVQDWLSWWLRPEHASMLFESERKMKPALWQSIPSTTNAQESMHFKLYKGIGKKLGVIELLNRLGDVSDELEAKFNAEQAGGPIRYGIAAFFTRKRTANVLGRTKVTRQDAKKHTRDDTQRPPDTVAELLKKEPKARKPSKNTQASTKPKTPKILYQSYTWDRQSCYLDTSLELLYQAITLYPAVREAFTLAFSGLSLGTSLRELHSALQTRWTLEASSSFLSDDAVATRDSLRQALSKNNVLTALYGPQPLLSWIFDSMDSCIHPDLPKRPSLFMRVSQIAIHYCKGCKSTGGPHMELGAPVDRPFRRLTRTDNVQYKGNVALWFKSQMAIPSPTPKDRKPCWRGEANCSGAWSQIERLIFSIPIVLLIEHSDTSARAKRTWQFPKTLTPLTPAQSKEKKVVYHFVGIGLYSASAGQPVGPTEATEKEQEILTEDELVDISEEERISKLDAGHFTARILKDGRNVYKYDGIPHGHSVRIPDATPQSHLYSKYPALPPKTRVICAVYVLEGGLEAQNEFFRIRSEEIQQTLKISFTSTDLDDAPDVQYDGDDLEKLDPSRRTWLSLNRRKNWPTHEYVTPTIEEPDPIPFIVPTRTTKQWYPDFSEPESEEVDSPPPVQHQNSNSDASNTLETSPVNAELSPEESTPADFPMSLDGIDLTDAEKERLAEFRSIPPPPAASDSGLSLGDHEEWDCRCGKKGRYQPPPQSSKYDPAAIGDEGEAIQCQTRGRNLVGCKNWSHKACQVNVQPNIKTFRCDWCSGRILPKIQPLQSQMSKTRLTKQRTSERKKDKDDMGLGKWLEDRLRPGIGALARRGDYWYPVRVIHVDKRRKKCHVRWWRGCIFSNEIPSDSGIAPGSVSIVDLAQVVDCLWGNRTERRSIRLGRFTSAGASEQEDDHILEHFELVAYTNEMHAALEPAIPTLKALLSFILDGTSLPTGPHSIPSYYWAQEQPRGAQMTVVPFPGDLTLQQRAQISSWFEHFIADDRIELRGKWTTTVPMAHAITAWLSYQQLDPTEQRSQTDVHLRSENLEHAWVHQQSTTGRRPIVNDIDRECQTKLEQRMFTVSKWAGIAGNYQWGLDAGDHQEGWDPYKGQEHYNDGTRQGDEKELLLGPKYIYLNATEEASPTSAGEKKPKPKPKRTSKPEAQ